MVKAMDKKINKIVEQKKEIFAILGSNECAASFENEIRIPEGHSIECALRYLRQQVNPVEVRTFMADNFFNVYELMGDFRGRELTGVDGDSVDDVESYYDKVEEIIALAWELEHALTNDEKPYGDISEEKEVLNKKISLPIGTFKLVQTLNYNTYIISCLKNKNEYEVYMEKQPEGMSNLIIDNYVKFLEKMILIEPYQFYHFYDMFK